jgi:hypothetical protein
MMNTCVPPGSTSVVTYDDTRRSGEDAKRGSSSLQAAAVRVLAQRVVT